MKKEFGIRDEKGIWFSRQERNSIFAKREKFGIREGKEFGICEKKGIRYSKSKCACVCVCVCVCVYVCVCVCVCLLACLLACLQQVKEIGQLTNE